MKTISNTLASTSAHETGNTYNVMAQPAGERKSLFNKSEIMKHAWRLFRGSVTSFAEALRKAWQYAKDAMLDAFWGESFAEMNLNRYTGEKCCAKSHMNYAKVGRTWYLKSNILNV